jgi:NDP-sugar pyrophosphorylase family protein
MVFMPPDTRSKPVHAIITSGGRSRRLAPLTDPTIHGRAVPKGILPLANIPAAEVMIGKLKQAGITEITFATAFMGSEIQRVLADGSRLGVHIEYRDDIGTDGPSGEMRAVANIAREQVRAGFNGRFLVVGSDILTSADFAEILSAHASNVTLVGEDSFPFVASNRLPVTMVVNAVPWAEVYRFGTVTTDEQGRVESFRQKDPDSPSNLNNSSIHVFEAAMFPVLGNLIERQLHTLPLFFQWLVANRNDALARRFPLFAYQHRGYWLDFGELEAYWRAQMDILDGKVPFSPAGTFIEKGQTVRIGRAKVIGPALVGDNVILGKKVLINPYTVIGEGYEIEARAQIGGSVLLSHPN